MYASGRVHLSVLELPLDDGDHMGWFDNPKANLAMAELLVSHGALIKVQNKDGETALTLAVEYGQVPVAEMLVHRGAVINLQDQSGWTALMYASRRGRVSVVQLLLDQASQMT